MTIDLAEIKVLLEELGPLVADTTLKASARKTKLDEKPVPPVNATTDEDWNDYQTDFDTWKAQMATVDSEYLTASNLQKDKERELMAIIPPNQWVYITSLLEWGDTTQLSIGHGSNQRGSYSEYVNGLFFITAADGEASSVFPEVES